MRITFLSYTLLIALASCAQSTEGRAILHYALTFLERPYVAHTLEAGNEEQLIMNLNEVDCTTYVEYALALTLAKGDTLCAQNYLKRIRYRDGVIDDYVSRLHYITEWIENGVRYGFFEDITSRHSTDTLQVELSFMSSHPNAYRHLKDSPTRVAQMDSIERKLSGQTIHYLPKEKLPAEGLPWIKAGDILCITTNIPGLDVVHLGFAYYKDGKLHLLHASSSQKKVLVSEDSFTDMFPRNKTWTGVRVLRINSSNNK